MTKDHFLALVKAADAKESGGWWRTPEGRHITLYVASGGASLTVSRVDSLKFEEPLVHAKTVRGEQYILDASDLFGGAAEGAPSETRKAGFV